MTLLLLYAGVRRSTVKKEKVGVRMVKLFRYHIMCPSFSGMLSVKMDDRLPQHAQEKIVKARAEKMHDSYCPTKDNKHPYHIHAKGSEILH